MLLGRSNVAVEVFYTLPIWGFSRVPSYIAFIIYLLPARLSCHVYPDMYICSIYLSEIDTYPYVSICLLLYILVYSLVLAIQQKADS